MVARSSFGVLLFLAAAMAADRPARAEDPPQRIVRASAVEGDASYLRGDADEWNALGVNTPLMTGDSLYAAAGGRAEVDLGRGSFARLGDDSQLDMVSLTPAVTQLGMGSGRLSLRVRMLDAGAEFEVDSECSMATIREPGLYRISVDGCRATYEVVSGGLSVVLNGQQLDVGPSESLSLDGSERPTYEYAGRRPAGEFDDWASARDRRFERAESTRYVHHEVEGREDLDDHGSWRPHAVYGRVWVPAGVGVEWAPYQNGRWVWQDPYGWTWVSYEAWGWAPYHYGRWVSVDGTWAWVPPPPPGFIAARGVIMPRPYYAPALVAFIGGSGWSLSVSMGGGSAVGWVPLAPSEPYYYAWQPAPRTTVKYVNVTVVNAVTVVQQNNFVMGGGRRVKVSRGMISRAPVMGSCPRGIAPTPESLAAYPHRRPAARAIPARAAARRPLVARLVPPPRPIPFAQKAEVIRKSGRPIERPVAVEGDVGRPFHRGAVVPPGVKAVSALAPVRPARLVARQGRPARAPRPIEHDILPAQRGPRGRPALRPEGARPSPPGTPEWRGAGAPTEASVSPHAGGAPAAEGGLAHPGKAAGPPRPAPVGVTSPPRPAPPPPGQPQHDQVKGNKHKKAGEAGAKKEKAGKGEGQEEKDED